DSLKRLLYLVDQLNSLGIETKYLDLGGGLGITYENEWPPHPEEYARPIKEELASRNLTLILEPGRVITGNAGILVTKVLYRKSSREKTFLIVDAAMNDLIRPSLYNSYHTIQPVIRTGRGKIKTDIVGPVCESGDFLAKDRMVEIAEPGELLAVMSAGAYGFTMSSNYNSRPRAAEVMVKDDKFYVVRERETYEDLIRGERIPDFMTG
ncbi:MAG TPA: diaminopimelate decarboxylase, partial [Desulfobacterales bacterium]|nr:diaminopimelate decarboxylase [Desulfobacterales bacterium]